MFAQARCSARLALVVSLSAALGATLAACGSIDSGRALLQSAQPYQATIVQGNFVSREQVQALQPGMSRQQVRDILGTPLVASIFHAERWEYIFTLKKLDHPLQTRKLTVYFNADVLARFEGDEMPTEAEFVATLGKPMTKKPPALQASEAQLARYPAPERPAPASTPPLTTANEGAAPMHYPPLESTAR